jgi:UDP-glucose 4-epimerase
MSAPAHMKVAVVGARGFIGRRLSSALAAAGHDVIKASSEDGHFDASTGILSPPVVAGAIDAVVYLSQSPRYREVPQQAAHLWAVNVVSAVTAAEWGRRHGARHYVYASSGTIYRPSFEAHRESDPLCRDGGYALSKLHGEEALQQFQGDLNVTCARFFGVYGPGQQGKLIPNLVAAIRSGRPVQIQPHPHRADDSGGVRLSLTHVDDAIGGLMRLLDSRRPGPINIASTDVLSIREIAEAIGAAVEAAPVFEQVASPREGDAIADPSQLAALLNRPFIPFASAIREVVESGTRAD